MNPVAAVTDVGINRIDAGSDKRKPVGDMDFAGSGKKTDAITPIPTPLRTYTNAR